LKNNLITSGSPRLRTVAILILNRGPGSVCHLRAQKVFIHDIKLKTSTIISVSLLCMVYTYKPSSWITFLNNDIKIRWIVLNIGTDSGKRLWLRSDKLLPKFLKRHIRSQCAVFEVSMIFISISISYYLFQCRIYDNKTKQQNNLQLS
jgi:hypothetical protein